MATQKKTRQDRRAAGWLEVTCLVPPELARMMEERRGEMPRSQWLVRQALSILPQGLIDGIALTWSRPGRPRTRASLRTPTLPDLAVPLRILTYRPIVLARHLGNESGAGSGSITIRMTNTDQVLISYRRYTTFDGVEVYDMARRHSGRWGRYTLRDGVTEAFGMLMPTARKAEEVLDWVREKQGKIYDERHRRSFTPLVRVRPLIRRIGDEPRAWSLEIDISDARQRGDLEAMHRFLATAWRWSPPRLGWFAVEEVPDLLVSSGITAEMLVEIRDQLAHQGAEVREDQPWGIAEDGVTSHLDALGLLYTLTANRQDRRCLALPDKCLAHEWPEWRSLLDDLDVDSQEEHPSHAPPEIDWSRVPGWSTPVASGKRLRDYQRAGIEFVASRGFRAMIGDAMRVGKTAQAIGAANARGCRRIVAVLPRSVVHVWRKQIEEWSHPGEEPRIIEVRSSTNPPALRDLKGDPDDSRATWVLVTYDMVTPRSESVTLQYREDQQEEIEEAFATAGAADAVTRVDKDTLKIVLNPDDEPLLRAVEQVRLPAWLRETEKIRSALTRAGGPVREALTLWDPDGVILDEAHRIKNPKSARTRTVRTLIQAPHRLGLLLSGTLIRNYFDVEGLPMLEAVVSLDDHYHAARRAGIDKASLAQTLFKHFMLRRKLSDVQDQLPPKIREMVEIPLGPKGQEFFDRYLAHIARADQMFFEVAARGGRMEEAKSAALGAWSQARHALIEAKIADGLVADAIYETVEASEAGGVVVFGHHIEPLNTLAEQLTAKGLMVVRAYGAVSQQQRVEAERLFQNRTADVYLGGLQTAEGISLDRADACVHIEQDWVPGVMLQAEARAEGAGQVAPNGYLIRTCMNAFGLAPLDDMDRIIAGILARKIRGLNDLYDEDESLEATVTLEGGNLHSVLSARSWAKAQERMRREGITPPEPAPPEPKPLKTRRKQKDMDGQEDGEPGR